MYIQSDSTKVTFTQVYQDVKAGLSALGEALKVGAEHVYEVLIRQQFVTSITHLIIYILMVVVTFVVVRQTPKWVKAGRKIDDYEPWGALYIIPAVCIITTVCFITGTLSTTVTGFVNPEYGAMKEIMEFVK